MRFPLGHVILVAVLVAAPQLGISQESPAALRWADVEKRIESHPAFQIAKRQIDIAEGESALTRQYPNPELGVSLGQSRDKASSAKSFIWNLELTIPVEWPGSYLLRREAAGYGTEAARLEAQVARLEVYRELRGLYLAVAADQERETTLAASEAHLVTLTGLVRTRVEKGAARPLELARAEEELEELRLERQAAQSEARVHREHLNAWLGAKLPADFRVDSDWETLPDLPSLEAALGRLAAHPSMKAGAARKRQAAAQSSAEKHAAVPSFGAGAFVGEEADSRSVGGLLTLSLPLWNWNLGGIAKAEAEARQAGAQAELTERRLREAVVAAQAKAQNAREAISRYAEAILPKAKRALADSETLYQAGDTGLLELLDARRALTRTQRGQAAVLFEYLNALLDLTLLTGGTPHA